MEEEEEMTDCNLELQLHPSSSTSSSASSPPLRSNDRCREKDWPQLPLEKIMPPGEEDLLPLTIFYGGETCVVTVNRQQARSIMLLAGRGRGRAINKSIINVSKTRDSSRCDSQTIGLASLSMKRSLQMFLEKRKHRIQSTNTE